MLKTNLPQLVWKQICLSQQTHVMPQPSTTWMPQPMNTCVPGTRNTCNALANRYMFCPSEQPHGCYSQWIHVPQTKTTYYAPATKYMLCPNQKMYRYKLRPSQQLHGCVPLYTLASCILLHVTEMTLGSHHIYYSTKSSQTLIIVCLWYRNEFKLH